MECFSQSGPRQCSSTNSVGRVAALVMRLTQSFFNVNEVRLVCYVDDPLAAIRGTDSDRRLFAAIMILVWMALGFKLAFAKGQLAREVT